ncbi:MAG: hypothetical protein QG565_595 [Campylobacterota bacterium]|nr:hypothetical protein [Campylobacterota bacterium]MDQ1267586.1 hypothetical protein [Campylobacterota bacterium]MDQ1337256.1 hypothetical protein [Campylobacterota bacterium]
MKIIIALLLFFLVIFADDDHEHRHINKELSHLNLSKEQSIEIKEILRDFKTELQEFEIFKKEIEERRKDLFLREDFDYNELEKLNQKLDLRAREIEKNLLVKIHVVLNLKQRVRFINHFDDWKVY